MKTMKYRETRKQLANYAEQSVATLLHMYVARLIQSLNFFQTSINLMVFEVDSFQIRKVKTPMGLNLE